MPQLIALVVFGAGMWAGVRWLKRESERVANELRRAEDELARRQAKGDALPTLKPDPDTGVYHPTNN